MSLFLLFLFLAFYAGTTLFLHTHIINGVTIAHSHFYGLPSGNNDSSSQHHHNTAEITMLQALTIWSSDLIPHFDAASDPFEVTGDHNAADIPSIIIGLQLATPALRGPPVPILRELL